MKMLAKDALEMTTCYLLHYHTSCDGPAVGSPFGTVNMHALLPISRDATHSHTKREKRGVMN